MQCHDITWHCHFTFGFVGGQWQLCSVDATLPLSLSSSFQADLLLLPSCCRYQAQCYVWSSLADAERSWPGSYCSIAPPLKWHQVCMPYLPYLRYSTVWEGLRFSGSAFAFYARSLRFNSYLKGWSVTASQGMQCWVRWINELTVLPLVQIEMLCSQNGLGCNHRILD